MLYNGMIWKAFFGTIFVSLACALLAGTIGTLVGYSVSKHRRSKWARYVNSMAFLPYLMPSIAVGAAFFVLLTGKLNLFNTYWILIIVGTIKYIPFASRSSLNSMLQLSSEIEEAAYIQNIPWYKRMFRIIVPIQKSSIISGYLLPFMTCMRELSLFMLLCTQGFILSTSLDYFDEMGLSAFSSGINLILIITILITIAIAILLLLALTIILQQQLYIHINTMLLTKQLFLITHQNHQQHFLININNNTTFPIFSNPTSTKPVKSFHYVLPHLTSSPIIPPLQHL
jgi:ABC-type Fe3+ transport system permease subunit